MVLFLRARMVSGSPRTCRQFRRVMSSKAWALGTMTYGTSDV